MKITRKQLRKLMFEATLADQYSLSDEQKQTLIQRVESMPSFIALQRAEDENYLSYPMFSRALIKAIQEEKYTALRRIGGGSPGRTRGSFPTIFVNDNSYPMSAYDANQATSRSREKAGKAFSSLGAGYGYVSEPPRSFNPVAEMFPSVAKLVADEYEAFVKYPEKYRGAGFGDRSFLQKAGSFLSGKGFRE